ncbi:polysaccharide deacetylase family protein [Kiritimatiellaeota bacterium B1221]|nr:polysaccharide deacetylase family protein [Kiritimatiellaeota bacterium B1221]
MKSPLRSIAVSQIFLFLSMTSLFAQVHIAPYKDDKAAAFSFTFDDGFRGQVNHTLEIIEPLGIKGTFFLIPEAMEGPKKRAATINWDEANALLEKGHELGTHGYVGQKLHEVDAETLDHLVNGSRELISKRTGQVPVSYAKPGGSQLTEPVVQKIQEHHLFIRDNQYLPNGQQLRYGNGPRHKWNEEKMRQKISQGIDDGKWMVPIVHAIVSGYAAFDSKEQFRTHCEWLVSQPEHLWIAPMGTVGRYVWQREHSEVVIRHQTPNQLIFSIKTTLEDPETFDADLTLVIPQADATGCRAENAKGRSLTTTILENKILVEVPVDAGEVTVDWK